MAISTVATIVSAGAMVRLTNSDTGSIRNVGRTGKVV